MLIFFLAQRLEKAEEVFTEKLEKATKCSNIQEEKIRSLTNTNNTITQQIQEKSRTIRMFESESKPFSLLK